MSQMCSSKDVCLLHPCSTTLDTLICQLLPELQQLNVTICYKKEINPGTARIPHRRS